MEKKQKQFMDLNRETAMRLWCKYFGKETKVKDFTGREIAKGAYNDRNSEFGWNVDHILPQSRGGKTADYNLICCHILTNDEKADKFPCFVANNRKFEIVKVENHYEINAVTKTSKSQEKDESKVNFYDSASGIRFFKKLKGIQNKARWVGSVLIRLQNVNNTAVIDFVEKFLSEENISYSMAKDYWNEETRILATNYNMPLKDDISTLLDKCILLNTYMKEYFVPMGYIKNYDICYQVNCFEEKQDMYCEAQKINFNDILNSRLDDALFINDLVYINTEAEDKEPDLDFVYHKYHKYDYTYTKLSKNLRKEVDGK